MSEGLQLVAKSQGAPCLAKASGVGSVSMTLMMLGSRLAPAGTKPECKDPQLLSSQSSESLSRSSQPDHF